MLSTQVVKNVAQATHYFLGQDNYYTENNTLAQEHSQWWGEGAKVMGLSGTVDPATFTRLLQGHLPNGERLGKKVDGEILHRPGFDLTFSAPKSVSLLALLGNDERIFQAIERATDKALELIEREQAKTRVMKDGVLMTERSGKLVVARFLHDLSRENDPQLHTHCVVLNMTPRKDGKWRSLASQLGSYSQNSEKIPQGFFEGVRHFQKYYGAVFRAELAYEMRELGYTVEKIGAYGFFEIAGISRESIQVYSQRRQDILEALKEQGLSGAKAAELATLKTRRAKQHINHSELKQIWETKAALRGLLPVQEAQQTVAQARQHSQGLSEGGQEPSPHPERGTLARVAMVEAIAHLSETQVALRESELLARAIYYSVGDVPVTTVLTALQEAQRRGDLIPLSAAPDARGERQFTTPELLRYEQTLLQAMTRSHSSGQPVVKTETLTAFLREHGDLTHEQQQAIRTIFSSEKMMTALAGPTGSGKTHLIAPMMTLAKLGGYQPILLTMKQAETLDLKKQLQKTPDNLRGWIQQLFDQKKIETVFGFMKRQETMSTLDTWLQKKPMLFVENATQLSSRQSSELAACVERLNGRLVSIGDSQASLTWRASTPFTQLLAQSIVAAHLTGNRRAMASPLKTVVADSLQKNIVAAFDHIGQRMLSVEDKSQRWETMAAHWTGLSTEERTRSVVLAPTHAATQELNLALREALKNVGEIARIEHSVTVLLPHYLRIAEQRDVRRYTVGQWIRFQQDYRALRVHRGDYRRIESIDKKTNQLLLANTTGKIRRWNPHQIPEGAIEVFDEKIRAISVGDTLVWHRSNKKKELVKGERVTVTAITEKHISLTSESGKSVKRWDLADHSSRHFDYGIALTPLQASHRHPEIVIAYQNSGSRQSHQRAFYQIVAQASAQAWIYTENKAQLLKTVQQQSGDKLTAIDAVLQAGMNSSLSSGSSFAPETSTAEHIHLLEKAVQAAIQKYQQGSALPEPEQQATSAVRYALAYLSEKEAAFAHKDVMTVALTHVLGKANHAQLEQAVVEAEKHGELIRGVYSEDGTRWTTREALTLERAIVSLATVDRGQMPVLVAADLAESYLQKTQPSTEHTQVLRDLSAKTDRVILLQGFAGTGKTTLLQHVEALQHVQHLLSDSQRALLCLAPTHTAVKEIRARGLVGKTLDRFLVEYAAGKLEPADYRHKVLVVDESSMISNRKLHDFLVAVKQLDAWALLMGDIHQYTAIDAGKPFAILQRFLFPLILTDITRQKDDTLKAAVKALYQKNFPEVFNVLEKNIIEVGSYWEADQKKDNRDARLTMIAEDYLDRDPVRRSKTLIITFGNVDRELQNEKIRIGRQQRGELVGERAVSSILVSRQLSEVERSEAMHYRLGDILRFNVSDFSVGIHKGDYWTVKTVLPEQQWIQLERTGAAGSDPILWKPRPHQANERSGVEVYHAEKRELMAGDLIRWTRSDEALGLLSPELAQVESVSAKTVTVRSLQLMDEALIPQGKPIELALGNPRLQHWDHAYAVTGYSAQGKTSWEVLINAESHRPQLTSQPSLLVSLTRAAKHLTLYTDDKQALLKAVMENPADKSSALEIMGENSVWAALSTLQSGVNQTTNTRLHSGVGQRVLQAERHPPAELSGEITGRMGSLTPAPVLERPAPPRLDAQRISHLLTDQAEVVLERLLGEPKTKAGNQYRYGTHQGSLVVTVAGDRRGSWYDFQTGQGGHLLKLIAVQRSLDVQRDFQAVLQEALKILGTSPAELSVQANTLTPPHPPSKMPTAASKAPTPEQQRSLRYAQQLARESQSVAGTLAERYLREHRGIALESFPDSVRFHPGIYSRKNEGMHPALLVVAKDSEEKVQAVQAIFLDKETAKKADVSLKKQTWGRPSQGSVALVESAASRNITYLAEGPETALSVYTALNGADVRVTLGKSNFKNIDPAKTSLNIVLCLDNDGQNPQSDKLIHTAAEKLREQGKQVWIAQPAIAGQDYNDVLLLQGRKPLKKRWKKQFLMQIMVDHLPARCHHSLEKRHWNLSHRIFRQRNKPQKIRSTKRVWYPGKRICLRCPCRPH